MGKDTKKLQILNGFRNFSLRSTPSRSTSRLQPHRKEGTTHAYCPEPNRQTLVTSLTAMEQRLGDLLEDRSRISQNLHDCILQSLYTIESNIQTKRRTASPHATNAHQPPTDIAGQINQLIGEIRHMIQGLNEGTVSDSSLTADLYALKSLYDEIGHVRVTLDLQSAALEVLTRDEEREILSIVREALSNCVRHARATHATISIRRRGAKIRLHISDDGNGFPVGDSHPRGYGLLTIESHARKIGGVFRIQSEAGLGTHLTVEFSLEPVLTPV